MPSNWLMSVRLNFSEITLVIILYLQRRITQLSTLSLMLTCLILSACGAGQFPGRLPPAPEWSYTDLLKWDLRSLKTDGNLSIHGHGKSIQHILISKRRALADANAVQDVKDRFIKLYKDFLAGAHYRQQAIEIIKTLPWEQIALTDERYFDPKKNIQHALVSVQQDRLIDALKFERSMDQSNRINWDQLVSSIHNFYKSFESLKVP